MKTTTQKTYTAGDLVSIKPEFSDGDDRFQTIVLEDRGDRVLVMHECGFRINPTECIAKEFLA